MSTTFTFQNCQLAVMTNLKKTKYILPLQLLAVFWDIYIEHTYSGLVQEGFN